MNFVGVRPYASPPVRPTAAPAGPVRHIALGAGQMWVLHTPRPGDRIVASAGRIWITQAGEPRDVILAPGDVYVPSTTGKIVAQSLTDAHLRITPPATPAGRVVRIAHLARRLLTRSSPPPA